MKPDDTHPRIDQPTLTSWAEEVGGFATPPVVDQIYDSFAWQEERSRTGGVKAVGTGEDAGEVLYGQDAEAALAQHVEKAAGGDEAAAGKVQEHAVEAVNGWASQGEGIPAVDPAHVQGAWTQAVRAAEMPAEAAKGLGDHLGQLATLRESTGVRRWAFQLTSWLRSAGGAVATAAMKVLGAFARGLAKVAGPFGWWAAGLTTAAAVAASPAIAVAAGLIGTGAGFALAPVAAVGAYHIVKAGGHATGESIRKTWFPEYGPNGGPGVQQQFAEGAEVDPATLARVLTHRCGFTVFSDAPAPASPDVGLGGPDGKRAADLLRESHRQTASLIVQLSRTAIGRLLAGDAPLRAAVLFTPEEHQQLADSLAGIIAAGDLLGRARVREKAKLAGQEDFAEGDPLPDPFKGYSPIPALPPRKAVDYFRGLVPSLAQGAERYGPLLDRHAFTLAHATDQVILEKVKGAILRALETGVSTTPDVQELIDSAGVSPRNPQYADMVVRTNVMDAYNQGTAAEMSEPDMREFFPVWRYDGILDSRTGDDHRPLIGRYWPADAPFPQVRGPRVFNCRCSPTPVSKYEWRRLAAGGARVEA